jgi:hypothetical protein
MKLYVKSSIHVDSIKYNKECSKLLEQMKQLTSNSKWEDAPEETVEKMVALVGGTCTYERKDIGKKMREYESDYKIENWGKAWVRMCKSDRIAVKYTIPGSIKTINDDMILPLTKSSAWMDWDKFGRRLVEDYYLANIGDVHYSEFDNMSPAAINEFNRIHP